MNDLAIPVGIVVTVLVAIVSGFIKYLFSRMDKHEQNTLEALTDLKHEVEEKRKETRDLLLELINTKFDAIWESIRDLKDKLP